ncbi:MAG TPA: hydantoinase/oxoprolinase family protein, partial [Burkholderiaceae bacterium]
KMRSFQRGLDPADSLLVAAGGGGAQHAAEVADLAGMTQVRVLPQASVIAALGMLCAAPTRTMEQAMDVPLDDDLLRALRAQVDAQGEATHWHLALCHAGQEFAIDVPWSPYTDTVDTLAERFEQRHAQLRGNVPARQALQVRQMRTVFEAALPQPAPFTTLPAATASAWDGLPPSGHGPAGLFAALTTVWVPEGWCWQRLADDSLLLERSERASE